MLDYTPTTPVITGLPSITAARSACQSAKSYCALFSLSTAACRSSIANTANLQDCTCAQDVLVLASRCEIDGSRSCELKSPVTSNLWSYNHCPGYTMSSIPSDVTSTQIVITSSAALPSARPPSSVSTPAPTNSAERLLLSGTWHIGLGSVWFSLLALLI